MSDRDGDGRFAGLGMLASALAARPIAVAAAERGSPPWTDGKTVFIDVSEPARAQLEWVAVQAALIGAGSLNPDVVRHLVRHRRLARRYLAVEGHRALWIHRALLPKTLGALADRTIAARSDSAAASLAIARGRDVLDAPPAGFGVIAAKKVLTACATARPADQQPAGHVPRREGVHELEEISNDEVDDSDEPDLFSSPVGGGGALGKWLKKLLSSTRKRGAGGGPPGADMPTHRTNSTRRGIHAVSSSATTSSEDVADIRTDGVRYPEWNAEKGSYRLDWCTVREAEPQIKGHATQQIEDAISVRRPLARLGMGLHRRHRQSQGDDIDIDAALEARVEVRAGSVPDEAVYLDSLRRRRDLSVLLLLDVSGSTAEPGSLGRTVHQQQRTAVANLMVALHDLGDRVALYAYYSQGRSAVTMVPVKRFDDHLDAQVVRRLNSLEPGAYSRLGAAIRHGASVLETRGGTSRRVLVVLSDGLAYDHGYERAYGAADARRALAEARRRGTGCVCLTVGASTDVETLRRVFGSTAHATVSGPDQIAAVIGPIFRSAIRSAEVRRKVS
ncbi:nitric oxide reductase activation protein [Mycolicibacterium conceptionense]|uniref:Nitric oxide reductase activation protein n=2 Tax=Mycolicibacterium conceptionense TaxID=451644 RepID=A0A0U1DWZ0_9MYCO|nr:nitric oxide reductase activation protein [Mycolicibacterium conceptionense]CQD24191.1 nitric oxide reductase activation protein [Mycolicibacterium conceptionense]